MDFLTNFTTFDWIIVAVYLLGTVVIGIYANRFVGDMADYIVAGRSLKSFASIATMLGSEIGLVTVMYTSQKGFTGGFAALHIGVVAGLACLLVGLTGFIVVPLRKTAVMTIPEYYSLRFSRGVRILGGVLLSVAGVLNMGVFLKAGAIFVTSITGLNDPAAVNIVMAVLISLVVLYTVLGGMVSVVITDYIQFVVLSFGMLACCWFAYQAVSWEALVTAVKEIHGEGGFNPLSGEVFGLTYIMWMIFVFGIVSCAVWPTAVMRVCAAENTKVVKRLYTWSSIGFLTRFIIPMFLGISALAYFSMSEHGRDYFFTGEGGVVADTNITMQALPAFLGEILPAGVIGLIVAGMLAAFMSTHDSYLLCWGSVFVEDVINPIAGGELPVRIRLLLARIMIVLIGAFLYVWSTWYPMGQDMLDYLAVSAAIYFIGAFTLLVGGLYWKQASTVGAYLALVTGLLAVFGLPPVQEAVGLTEGNLGFELTEAHVGLGATALAVVLMVAGSFLFPGSGSDRTQGEQV